MIGLLINKKFVKYARIGIYAAGGFLLILVLYANVFRIEINTFEIKNDGTFPLPNFYEIPTSRSASEIEMEIVFKETGIDVRNLQVFAVRTQSALLRKRNEVIFEPEKLKKLIGLILKKIFCHFLRMGVLLKNIVKTIKKWLKNIYLFETYVRS